MLLIYRDQLCDKKISCLKLEMNMKMHRVYVWMFDTLHYVVISEKRFY